MHEQVLALVELLQSHKILRSVCCVEAGWDRGRGRGRTGRNTFLTCAFHSWTPIRTFTVFCMRPAETTTAGIWRVAAWAIFVVDILFSCSTCTGTRCEEELGGDVRVEWLREALSEVVRVG